MHSSEDRWNEGLQREFAFHMPHFVGCLFLETERIMMNEVQIRLTAFIGILLLLMLWESLARRRTLAGSRPFRWAWNFLLVIVDALCIRAVAAIGVAGVAVGAAHWASENQIGLFNWTSLPPWLSVPISFVLLDFVIYLQHVLVHRIPVLWRVHKVHHSDVAIDVSTALRFHPIEIVLSMLLKVVIVIVFGISVAGVLVFEVVLNGMAMFNHANIKLPIWVDRWLRRVVVTPDMHRVHHSVHPDETDRNYGFCLSIWDLLCGTYRAQPRDGHEHMRIGLAEYQDPPRQNFLWILSLPFQGLSRNRDEK